MNYDAIIEQLRAWADTLSQINRGVLGPVVLSHDAAAHLAVTIVGMRQMADDLEVHQDPARL